MGVLQVWASSQNSFIPLMFFRLSLTLAGWQGEVMAILTPSKLLRLIPAHYTADSAVCPAAPQFIQV